MMNIPHCPNPECTHFSNQTTQNWYIRHGFHSTRTFGTVQRYRCKHCHTNFSTQTFSIDYWAKKHVDYHNILQQLVSSSGLMDISRHLNISVGTIQNRIDRMARCALAIHSQQLKDMPMQEDFVLDGFESFSLSQYYPNNINIVAGSQSEFIYALGFSNLRRKGKMTKHQKQVRAMLESRGKAHPKAIERSTGSMIEFLIQSLSDKRVTRKLLITDEHKAYKRAFGKIKGFSDHLEHVTVSSKEPRSFDNQLFAVNYIDRQLRKDMSDHIRETVKFARCPSAMMIRMAVYRFYHNALIARRVREFRRDNRETHSERAQLDRSSLVSIIEKYWLKRVFVNKIDLGEQELMTWFCRWRNPMVKLGRYVPGYIAA